MSLPFVVDSVPRARRLVTSTLEASAVPAETIADVALVLTELATNAVTHGAASPDDTFDIGWAITDRHIRISVHDSGRPANLSPRPLTDDRLGGRGLAIVELLADWWNVEQSDGHLVTVEFLRRE